ncbi:hypothetical protein QTH91_10450 [Variovorax dokdonensis]|uniref:Uncharacterized protein n=1 Tax=Variovorax dokdonensis TaxID=344883 RepID=A0ABT7NAJ9_9BURK|nr:hypothetical protein [Variovorax dokdonensis]MDM0044905.1 hypothetical protein [Variovorax dokdonensis]
MARPATQGPSNAQQDDVKTPDEGNTRSTRGPRLPHEHDESADSQKSNAKPDAKARRAHDDVERGVVDTDRGPMMDRLYREKLKR